MNSQYRTPLMIVYKPEDNNLNKGNSGELMDRLLFLTNYGNPDILVDCSSITECDSSVSASFIRMRKIIEKQQIIFGVLSPSEHVMRRLEVGKIAVLIRRYEDALSAQQAIYAQNENPFVVTIDDQSKDIRIMAPRYVGLEGTINILNTIGLYAGVGHKGHLNLIEGYGGIYISVPENAEVQPGVKNFLLMAREMGKNIGIKVGFLGRKPKRKIPKKRTLDQIAEYGSSVMELIKRYPIKVNIGEVALNAPQGI